MKSGHNIWKPSRRLFKILIISFLIITVSFILFFWVYFQTNQDQIKATLLRFANRTWNGELTAQNIDYSILAHFPRVSLVLERVDYFEQKPRHHIEEQKPFCQIENLFFSIDVLDLIQNRINISEVTLSGGQIRLIRYPDSTYNLLNALSGNPIDAQSDTTASEIGIRLDNITLIDMDFIFENKPLKRSAYYYVNNLKSHFSYTQKIIEGDAEIDLHIQDIRLEDGSIFQNKDMLINADFRYDELDQFLQIRPSRIKLGGLEFKAEGTIDFKKDGFIDLKLDASDEDLTLLSFILKKNALEYNLDNLANGDLFLRGYIKGKLDDHLPGAKLWFGGENINLKMPGTSGSISDLHFKGYFSSGEKADFSQAILKLENISANLPEGKMSGSFILENLKKPQIDLNLNVAADINCFDQLFKIDELDSLSGRLIVSADIKGTIDLQKQCFIQQRGSANIDFEGTAFRLRRKNYSVRKINGRIKKEGVDIFLKDLSFQIAGNDFKMNGSIGNFIPFLMDADSALSANVNLTSDSLELAHIIAFNPTLSKILQVSATELNMAAGFSLSRAGLSDYTHFFQGKYNIRRLSGRSEQYPGIHEINCNVTVDKDSAGAIFELDSLHLQTAYGKASYGGTVKIDTAGNVAVNGDALFDDIHPQAFIKELAGEGPLIEKNESGADTLNTLLNLRGNFIYDSLVIRDALVSANSLRYEFGKKIEIDDFELRLDRLDFRNHWTQALAKARRFKTDDFSLSDVKLFISAQNDTLQIRPQGSLFGEGEAGLLMVDFSREVPRYQLQLKLEKIPIERLIANFSTEQIISGPARFEAELSGSAAKLSELPATLEGYIHFGGKQLTVYGIDIDLVISRLQRTQRINLIDIGAYFFAGPIGALFTKGMDVANLLGDPGQSSEISAFLANWKISNGQLQAEDVALATNNYRIALKGGVDFINDSIDNITIAIVDEKGCRLVSQKISGNFDNPQVEGINIVGPLARTVDKIFRKGGCQSFYTGKLPHPLDKK